MSELRIFVEVLVCMSTLLAFSFGMGLVVRRLTAMDAPPNSVPAIEAPREELVPVLEAAPRPFRLGQRIVASERHSRAARQRHGLRVHAIW